MAETSYAIHGLDLANPITLKAAGAITESTDSADVFLGKGFYIAKITWTTCVINDNDELYNITLEADTAAATSTYVDLGVNFVAGALEVNGGQGDTPATGEVVFGFNNPQDNNVRVATFVSGTTPSMNFAVEVFPMRQAEF